MNHLAFKIMDNWIVAVHDAEPPGPSWASYVDGLHHLFNVRRLPRAAVRILVYTQGGGPDAAQRRAWNEVAEGLPTVAVVTPNTQVRLVVNALTLFNSTTKMFAPHALRDALHFLRATEAQGAWLWHQLRTLQRDEMPHVKLPELNRLGESRHA